MQGQDGGDSLPDSLVSMFAATLNSSNKDNNVEVSE